MKRFHAGGLIFPLCAKLLALVCVALLPGCAVNPKSLAGQEKEEKPYTDPASGVVLPKHAGSMDRVSLDNDDPEKNPVTARYSPAESGLYIDAAIRIQPALQVNPDQLLSVTIRSLENRSGFAEADYRGLKTFGGVTATCAECSFDRPEKGDRVTFKIVIIPRGNFLLCFTFLVHPGQERETQPVIDGFIQDILAGSGKKVLLAPASTPEPDDSD